MLVIGITGQTGCGKTPLLQAVQQRGGYIVDCDALNYEPLASEEGADLRRELQTAFPAAFDAGGRLRRKALGQLVFGDQARMAQLNEIVFFHIGRRSGTGGSCLPSTRSTCSNPVWQGSAIRPSVCSVTVRRASGASWRATA